MSEIDLNDRDALSLHLRSKTPLGRLNDAEVHVVLDYLASIGFGAPVVAPAPEAEPEPIAPAPETDADPAPLAPPPAS